jgi:pyruvate,water dikinase
VNTQNYVYWLRELDKDDVFIAGRKCKGLGEMLRAGLPVPPGFAISLKAYEKFIDETGVGKAISSYFEKIKDRLQENVSLFDEASEYICQLIESTPIPGDIQSCILDYYRMLCDRCNVKNVRVAVRSSGPVSMPGQFDTYLNVQGEEELLKRVKKVWASSFNGRAMHYRLQRGMPVESSPIGIAVLKMVNARASGVMFTLDPLNGDRSTIFIEASWGLGESLVSGQVTPDKFALNKVTLSITKRVICNKAIEMVYGPEGDVVPAEVEPDRQNAPCLTDEEIIQLGKLGKLVEANNKLPQDIEWAIDKDLPFPRNIILLQTRPETVWNKKEAKPLLKPNVSALNHIANNLLAGKKLVK